MESALPAPMSPLSPRQAAPLSALQDGPLSPRWPMYRAVVLQGESDAR
jgi:hypothetical protein